MAMPSDIRASVLDKIRVPSTDTSLDSTLNDIYDRVLTDLVRETDLLAEEEKIDSVAGQRIYTSTSRATRILAVLHQESHLRQVSSQSLDLSRRNWQVGPNRDPEVVSFDKIPPSVDGFSGVVPENFLVDPAPNNNGTGNDGLLVYLVAVPADGNPKPLWLKEYLTYQVVGELLTSSIERRDASAGAFFLEVAGLWKQVIEMRLP